MCGRYVIKSLPQTIIDAFSPLLPPLPDLFARYNVAPTQPVPVVRASDDGARRLDMVRWGLIPSWAADAKVRPQPINVRSETIEDRPMFRNSFRRRRCLIPADGFYEWQAASGAPKQPFFIHRRDDAPFAFAAVWESWRRPPEAIDSCALLTTRANKLMEPIHDRMPVILRREDFPAWLDPMTSPASLKDLLQPCPESDLEAYAVSPYVNAPKNDGPQCIARPPV